MARDERQLDSEGELVELDEWEWKTMPQVKRRHCISMQEESSIAPRRLPHTPSASIAPLIHR
jgi:hypothetical protein